MRFKSDYVVPWAEAGFGKRRKRLIKEDGRDKAADTKEMWSGRKVSVFGCKNCELVAIWYCSRISIDRQALGLFNEFKIPFLSKTVSG